MATKDETQAELPLDHVKRYEGQDGSYFVPAFAGIPMEVVIAYCAYAFLWQSCRGFFRDGVLRAMKRKLREYSKAYPQLPEWWGTQEELPF